MECRIKLQPPAGVIPAGGFIRLVPKLHWGISLRDRPARGGWSGPRGMARKARVEFGIWPLRDSFHPLATEKRKEKAAGFALRAEPYPSMKYTTMLIKDDPK